MTTLHPIRTVLASPYDGTLYGSPYLWRDANYAYMTEPRGWQRLSPLDVEWLPPDLRAVADQLTPGEYADDRA